MKRGHHAKSPKGKGSNYHNKSTTGDSKRRKSGGRGGGGAGASPYGEGFAAAAPRRNRSRSGGFQEFGNFLWTFDASSNHWVARENDSPVDASPAATNTSYGSAAIDIGIGIGSSYGSRSGGGGGGGHSKAALRELSDFGREFPAPHKGKKGRGGGNNNSFNGGSGRKGQQHYSKSNPQSSMMRAAADEADDAADYAFVGFGGSPHNNKSAGSPGAGSSSFMMRFVKGETMNDERENKSSADDEASVTATAVEVKVEMKEVKLEAVEVKIELQHEEVEASSHARPVQWQGEQAIPKYTPVVSHSRALGMPSVSPQQTFSGRGRGRGGRGRGRGAASSNSPTSPVDFHWTYAEKMLDDMSAEPDSGAATTTAAMVMIKQERTEDVIVIEPEDGGVLIAATSTAVTSQKTKPAQQAHGDNQTRKASNKKNKKWEEKQMKNRARIGLEPMESDSALFTTRDLVRARMQSGAHNGSKKNNKSSEDDEENAQADEDFLFGRGGRETRKGAPVKGKMQPKGKKQQQKKGKKGFVYDVDDEDSEDDGMVLDDELIRDYMLNTELSELNLDEEAMEEHLLLHIVSQLNDYHLSEGDDDDDDDDDDEDDDDEEEEDSDEDSDEEDSDEEEDDSEEDIYDEYGDDEKEEEKELAKKLKETAKKAKKTPLGLATWDDAETAVVNSAAEETFDAVLNADFTLLRSDRPPSFQQRLRKSGGGGGGSWPAREERAPYQRGNKNKKWKTPEKGGKGRYTKKGKWYDQEFNEETITDEEELPYIDRTPLKRQPRGPSGMITVHSINESIRSFIANDDKEWLELPPMNKKQRVMVHQLSQLYHLKSKSYGSGRTRFPTLVKTVYTCYPPHGELLEFLNRAAKIKATNGAPAPKKKLSKEENKQLRKLKNMRKRDSSKETFVSTKREMDGKVVGEGAVPLGQETIGARLLLSMGWSGGGLVGTNGEGIAEPLMAIVKNNRKGLGF